MIVLDTNVISEPMRLTPAQGVVAWLDEQHVETLHLTTITLAEVRYGIAALPDGRRRQGLRDQFENDVVPVFGERLLPFDEAASQAYASLMAATRAQGQPMGILDGQIAAICLANNYALATRNVRDFDASGLDLINPWAN